jgi:hypothetical protein
MGNVKVGESSLTILSTTDSLFFLLFYTLSRCIVFNSFLGFLWCLRPVNKVGRFVRNQTKQAV